MIRKCLITGAMILWHAAAQTIPYETHYRFGGLIPFANRWEGPTALDLVPVAGGRSGKVWLRQTPEGILIFARITGGRPAYARFPAEMSAHDHVELWLAASRNVEMPELGWGNQFGLTNCKKDDSGTSRPNSESCQSWETRQLKYREQLRRLFMRRWELTPEVSFETYASEAYSDLLAFITNRDRASLAKLEPHGGPLMAAADSPDFSYFEVFVRWSDFPPANLLNVSNIYVALDFCGPGHACVTTSPARKDGDPSTFNQLALERPKPSSISPCGYPLEETDLWDNRYPAWYFLSAEGRATDIFALENYVAGYQYGPEGLSPIPIWKHHFSKSVGKTEVVCGPDLRYVAGNQTYASDGTVAEGGQNLAIRNLPNGTHLLKVGPTLGALSPLGSGQCGSCETADFAIYHLNPSTGITVAFSEQLVMEPPDSADADIRVATDWQTVTVYRAEEVISEDQKSSKEVWSSKRYCLSGATYRECGEGPSTAPPRPRQIQWGKNGN
jgi:hypothetical protein